MAKVQDVAAFIVSALADETGDITNMKLNKLLYFAQGYSLARRGVPLFDDAIAAWKLGPVVPAIYKEYSRYGGSQIPVPSSGCSSDLSDDEEELLYDVLLQYGDTSAYDLSDITHMEGTPWSDTPQNRDISNALIGDFFGKQEPLPSFEAIIAALPHVNSRRSDNGALILPAEEAEGWEWDE